MVFFIIIIKFIVGFLCKLKKSRNACETVNENYKILLAECKYCAQFDSILHMLPKLLSGVPNRLRWFYAVWSELPVCTGSIVGFTEKAVLSFCSLIGISPIFADCRYCLEC